MTLEVVPLALFPKHSSVASPQRSSSALPTFTGGWIRVDLSAAVHNACAFCCTLLHDFTTCMVRTFELFDFRTLFGNSFTSSICKIRTKSRHCSHYFLFLPMRGWCSSCLGKDEGFYFLFRKFFVKFD